MDWIYRFTANERYPDPVEEIDALCTLDDSDEQAYLLLANRTAPPMSGASCEEVVGLCTSENGKLILHATGVIGGVCIHGKTPASVEPLYGRFSRRSFSPLIGLRREKSKTLDETVLSKQDQQAFLKGQSFVKKVAVGRHLTRKSSNRTMGKKSRSQPTTTQTAFSFPSMAFSHKASEFIVVGLDPTAGTWDSKMAAGPKDMPSFFLRWDGKHFHAENEPLQWHSTNSAFWNVVQRSLAKLICIDGPWGTNGPRLLPDLSGWDRSTRSGTRGGELALSREGVNLFWTTQNTVERFDGASRWIARSLVLFSERPKQPKIETHPHGAFTFFWRMFGKTGTPPKKLKKPGRDARLAILRSFIPGLTDGMVPNHDAIDAACAALIAGLHQIGLTKPFGTMNDGGVIWMPDTEKLASMVRAGEGASDV
jgi:hypothetical protein